MTRRAAAFLVLTLGACRSAPPTLHELYQETLEEMQGAGGVTERTRARNAARYEEVRRRMAEQGLETAQDHLYAAGVLSTSDDREDLELARQLATYADELGEERGRVLVAETTDKILLQMGGRQHYGTQIYLNMATGRWELYPFDPAVTDETRAYMGLPPLAEVLARVDQLNGETGLRDSVIKAIQE